jgi:ParB family chromosome partitioning protein
MGDAAAMIDTTPDTTLSITRIKPNKDQPRKHFDEDALQELADSIRNNGVLQPILVRKKGSSYEIVAGERRYQAAKLAGLKEVPVLVRDVSDDEILQLALIENLQRADLNPIETARGFKTLIEEKGLTQEELGTLLSKSRSAIANTIRLLDLPSEVQDFMADSRLSAGHARAILAVAGDEGRLKLAEKVIAEGLTVRQTENLAPLFSVSDDGEEAKTTREPTPQSFKRAAHQLRKALNTNVRVRRVRNKNKIEIEFQDEQQLARLVDLLDEAAVREEA